jgi:hypothetical protein
VIKELDKKKTGRKKTGDKRRRHGHSKKSLITAFNPNLSAKEEDRNSIAGKKILVDTAR